VRRGVAAAQADGGAGGGLGLAQARLGVGAVIELEARRQGERLGLAGERRGEARLGQERRLAGGDGVVAERFDVDTGAVDRRLQPLDLGFAEAEVIAGVAAAEAHGVLDRRFGLRQGGAAPALVDGGRRARSPRLGFEHQAS
jgi:hypothetical protein